MSDKTNNNPTTLYLHIGMHKTGTTSIQQMLALNSEWFRERQSILYPTTGRPTTTFSNGFGQHELAWSLRGIKGFTGTENWIRLSREFEQSTCSTVLISAEGFGAATEEELDRLISLTHQIERTKAILYLRNPTDFLAGAYKQWVKNHQLENRSLRDFALAFLPWLDYANLVARWESVLGTGDVIVKSFDYEVRHKGLEQGFASIFAEDLTGLRIPKNRANVSPSDLSTRLARHINSGVRVLGPSSRSGKLLKRIKSKTLRTKVSKRLIQRARLNFKPEQCIPNLEELCRQQRQALQGRLTADELNALFPWIGE